MNTDRMKPKVNIRWLKIAHAYDLSDSLRLGVGKVQVAVNGVKVVHLPPLFERRAVVGDLVTPAAQPAAQVQKVLVAVDNVVTL